MINALKKAALAVLYICAVVFVMYYGSRFLPGDDMILMPIAMISLFTLSAAVMGYLFLAKPIELYFANKKKEAIGFFLQTVGIFAGFTAIIFAILFIWSATAGK